MGPMQYHDGAQSSTVVKTSITLNTYCVFGPQAPPPPSLPHSSTCERFSGLPYCIQDTSTTLKSTCTHSIIYS